MKALKDLQIFIAIFFLWVVSGYVNAYVAYLAVLVVFTWLIASSKFQLLILAFLQLLIFSDSRHEFLLFAVTIKPVIAVMLGVISYLMVSKRWAPNTALPFYLPFVAIMSLTLLVNFNISNALKSLSMLLIIFNIPVLTYYVLKKDKKYFIELFFYSVSFMLLIGLLLKFSFPHLTTLDDRYTGILGNPNGLGLFLTVYYFLFQVSLYYFPRLFSKRVKFMIYFLIFSSLFFCQSRNAIMNIMVFHIFMYVNKRSVVLSFVVLGVLLTSYSLMLAYAIQLIEALGLQEYARLETLESGSGRTIAWDFIWEKIEKENYWIGTGIGSTEAVFKENYTMLSKMGHQGNAHNSYLTIWYDLGLFGMLAFFIGYLANMLRTVKNYIAFPIAIGLLLSANFESWLAASLNPFHIGAIMIITFLHYISDEKINEKREAEIAEEKRLAQLAKKPTS